MLSIVSDNPNTPINKQHCPSTDLQKSYNAWKANTNNAYYFHQKMQIPKAILHFKKALAISKTNLRCGS